MPRDQQRASPRATSSDQIKQEIQRFESVHPCIYAVYDLVDLVPDPLLAQQIRDHVVCIEGWFASKFYLHFIYFYLLLSTFISCQRPGYGVIFRQPFKRALAIEG